MGTPIYRDSKGRSTYGLGQSVGNGSGQSLGGLTIADIDRYILSNPIQRYNVQGTKTGRLLSGFTNPPYSNTDKKWFREYGTPYVQERTGVRKFTLSGDQLDILENTLNDYEDRLASARTVIDEQREEMAKLKATPTLAVAFLERVKQL